MHRQTTFLLCALALLALPLLPLAAHAAADKKAGKAKFQQYCTACHGPEGKGNGPAAAALNPKPENFTNASHMKKYTDAHMFKAIKEGGAAVGESPSMPPWGGSLSDQDIRNVIAYIRTLAKK